MQNPNLICTGKWPKSIATRTSVATGETASEHQLDCPDGGIYLKMIK
jgi:hypothetical protein